MFMKIIVWVFCLLVLVTAKSRSPPKNEKKKRQKTRFEDRITQFRIGPECNMFDNDDHAFNCAAYHLSPNCFKTRFKAEGKGLELGEIDTNSNDRFYTCLVQNGLLGD